MKNEIITYNDGSLELNVPVSWDEETVWLTRVQMAELFDRDVKTIGKHILCQVTLTLSYLAFTSIKEFIRQTQLLFMF